MAQMMCQLLSVSTEGAAGKAVLFVRQTPPGVTNHHVSRNLFVSTGVVTGICKCQDVYYS